MYLKSTPFASNIAAPRPGSTLTEFCAANGEEPLAGYRPIPIETFIRYGLWFKDLHVADGDPATVVRVARGGSGFTVTLDTGDELPADNVIVATGLGGAAYLPPELADLHGDGSSGRDLVSHSSDHDDLSRLAGRRVAVIGGGQSALESAALLREAGAGVEVFVRGANVRFARPPHDLTRQSLGTPVKPESQLGPGWSHVAFSRLPGGFRFLPERTRLKLVATVLGPSGAWWLRERVDGRIPIHLNHRLERATSVGQEITLTLATPTGGRHTATFDHVLAATGYRVDVDALSFLDPTLRGLIARTDGTWPALGRHFESSVPGLHFVGLSAAATFGPVMRFVCGTGFAARRVSAAVARRVRGPAGP
jgi:thioredoxin reductase